MCKETGAAYRASESRRRILAHIHPRNDRVRQHEGRAAVSVGRNGVEGKWGPQAQETSEIHGGRGRDHLRRIVLAIQGDGVDGDVKTHYRGQGRIFAGDEHVAGLRLSRIGGRGVRGATNEHEGCEQGGSGQCQESFHATLRMNKFWGEQTICLTDMETRPIQKCRVTMVYYFWGVGSRVRRD